MCDAGVTNVKLTSKAGRRALYVEYRYPRSALTFTVTLFTCANINVIHLLYLQQTVLMDHITY